MSRLYILTWELFRCVNEKSNIVNIMYSMTHLYFQNMIYMWTYTSVYMCMYILSHEWKSLHLQNYVWIFHDEGNVLNLCFPITVVSSYLQLLNTWSMASVTKKLNLKFYLILNITRGKWLLYCAAQIRKDIYYDVRVVIIYCCLFSFFCLFNF